MARRRCGAEDDQSRLAHSNTRPKVPEIEPATRMSEPCVSRMHRRPHSGSSESLPPEFAGDRGSATLTIDPSRNATNEAGSRPMRRWRGFPFIVPVVGRSVDEVTSANLASGVGPRRECAVHPPHGPPPTN